MITPPDIHQRLADAASAAGLDLHGATIRRSSSRFCLGVEHGDYNGMELFGVGTDRYIWLAYQPNALGRIRVFSANFPEDGLVDIPLGEDTPVDSIRDSWARFPCGVAWLLRREGYPVRQGFDAVLYGNIPGGGMSRSASLALNLVLTLLEVNGVTVSDGMRIVDLAQMVETDYIGSPCGKLDQAMIYFAQQGLGTRFNPVTGEVQHIPFGGDADSFRIVSLDTGTKRPGLEKSTYRLRRQECDAARERLHEALGVESLAGIDSASVYAQARAILEARMPAFLPRLKYLFEANQRLRSTIEAWRGGDIVRVGANFRADGIGLRDDYQISGPELETMCDLARTVEGVYGERMLGGGDKGASGALVHPDALEPLRAVIAAEYPRLCPDYATQYAVHACRSVDGIVSEPWGVA